MWPFKSKFDKLKRDEVVKSICDLETREQELENEIERKTAEIDKLMAKGKVEKSNQQKLFIAKKINFLKAEIQQNSEQVLYLLYNLSLLSKLKNAIDDDIFIKGTKNVSLTKLLADQSGLAKFLNKALDTKVSEENIMTGADDTFNVIKDSYEPNQRIYGVNEHDDQLLAMFESDEYAEEIAASDNELVAAQMEEK